jgi:hypothetical protein
MPVAWPPSCAIGHLAAVAPAAADAPGLLAVLASVADPRRRRGVHHRLAAIMHPVGVRGASPRQVGLAAALSRETGSRATMSQVVTPLGP